jgi:hypothetical protein
VREDVVYEIVQPRLRGGFWPRSVAGRARAGGRGVEPVLVVEAASPEAAVRAARAFVNRQE